MTTTTAPTASPAGGLSRLGWVASDSWEMARRSLVHVVRQPFMVVFTLMQPVMFALLFRYAFSGALQPFGPTGDYVDFLMPGVLAQTVAFGAMATASGLASDLATGAINRFRSLPMARSAILVGHTCAGLLRSLLVVTVMATMGFAIGFEFQTTWPAFLAGLGVMLAFAYALIWILALVGVAARDLQTAQGAVFQLLFPLTFASSAFVPTDLMPGWLRVFTDHQPVTAAVDATRALMLGGPTTEAVLATLAWTGAILLVFPPLAVHKYRRRTN